MTVDEDRVRTLLQTTGVPLSRLDAGALLVDSKHSQRRRRLGTVAGVALAVVGVAVPAAVVLANRTSPPEPPAPAATVIANTTKVEHRRTTLGPPTECAPTPFPLPGQFTWDHRVRTDPTGRYVIKTNAQRIVPYMWTDGTVAQLPFPGGFYPVAVNTGGDVFGHTSEPGMAFRYHDGALQTLATPDGFQYPNIIAANARGDALGTVFSDDQPQLSTDLAVWPADRPDRPRILDGEDLSPIAILDDSTVLALLRTSEDGLLRPKALVVIAPDDTRTRIDLIGDLAGIFALDDGTAVRGDFLYGHYSTTHWPDLHPVRWNLRTGQVEIFDDLFALKVGNSAGWFTAADRAWGDAPAVVVGPDGSARMSSADQHVTWIGPTGAELIGSNGEGGDLVAWRCS